MPLPFDKRPDLFGRDTSEEELDEVIDALFHFISTSARRIIESPFDFLLHFETLKLDFRNHLKEILRHAK